MGKTQTREEWLTKAAGIVLAKVIRPADLEIEDGGSFRIACGWPVRGGLSRKKRTVGQCWPPECSADGRAELFVSPYQAEPIAVLATVTHELLHACIGTDHKHDRTFGAACRQVGLEGKPTETHAGDTLKVQLEAISERLGPYPHAVLDKDVLPKQSTRLIKVECPKCGYTCRVTRKWITVGLPTCPCGELMEAEELPEED